MYNYDEAINLLIVKFPSLRIIYEDDVDYYEGLPYLFYESIFVKYIMDRIKSYNEIELSFIFDFIEDILSNGDERIKNLVEVSIIESFYYEESFKEFNDFLSKFYGILTAKSVKDCLFK